MRKLLLLLQSGKEVELHGVFRTKHLYNSEFWTCLRISITSERDGEKFQTPRSECIEFYTLYFNLKYRVCHTLYIIHNLKKGRNPYFNNQNFKLLVWDMYLWMSLLPSIRSETFTTFWVIGLDIGLFKNARQHIVSHRIVQLPRGGWLSCPMLQVLRREWKQTPEQERGLVWWGCEDKWCAAGDAWCGQCPGRHGDGSCRAGREDGTTCDAQ